MSFYTLYRDLTREGPGEPADVAWALAQAGTPRGAEICDVACGSGADIAPMLKACPEAKITAFDKQAHFIDEARARVGNTPQVELYVGDMNHLQGSFDLIWCAGAVYFIGIKAALDLWKPSLEKGGAIAFSQICWWTDTPAKPARDFWADYADMPSEAGIEEQVVMAGFKTIATRRLAASAWEFYYRSLEHRIEILRDGANDDLQTVLEDAATEIAIWRTHQNDFGYLLSVVKPQ